MSTTSTLTITGRYAVAAAEMLVAERPAPMRTEVRTDGPFALGSARLTVPRSAVGVVAHVTHRDAAIPGGRRSASVE